MKQKSIRFAKIAVKMVGLTGIVLIGLTCANMVVYSLMDDGSTDPGEVYSHIEELNFSENYVSNVLVVELPTTNPDSKIGL